MTFTCPYCGDTMPEKFTHSHLLLCLVAELLIAPRVDDALERLFP